MTLTLDTVVTAFCIFVSGMFLGAKIQAWIEDCNHRRQR